MTIEEILIKVKKEFSAFEIDLLIKEMYYLYFCPYQVKRKLTVGYYVFDKSFLKKEIKKRNIDDILDDSVYYIYQQLMQIYDEYFKESESLSNEEKNEILFKSQEKEDEYVALANEINDDVFLFDIANRYYTGEFVKINYEKSLKYNEMSAKIDETSESNNNLGYIYYYGRTGKVDYKKSLHYFEIASKYYPQAMYKVGDFYMFGKGVEKNYKLAHEYYLKSLKMMQDNRDDDIYVLPDIYMRLASDYAEGYGTEIDYSKADEYNKKAIELLEKRMSESNFSNCISNPAYKRCMQIRELLKDKI